MKAKRITAIALIMSLITSTVLASVLGSEKVSEKQVRVAKGTTYINNVYMSDQTSVGKQNETYYIYEPNDGVVPVIVNDKYIYGKTKLSQITQKMKDDGMYPLMVMNGDYFSLQTGVQMGNQVIDGVVVTKDNSGQDAIGIRQDGTAFMSWLKITTTVTVGENSFNVENINKYPQPYSIYLLDDKFSDTTASEKPSYNVIIGELSGEMTIDGEVSGVVEQIIESEGATEIPEGKIVLCVDKNIASEKMEYMKLLNIGDEITITNTFEGDKRWSECKYIQGSIGGRLIKDGEILDVDQDASPRTAIGIKQDGTMIFYTIDGRQKGHSYGLRLKTLAKRLYELGCVDAINFDGGGSTQIAGTFPGYDDVNLLNKPSDGAERKVATFFALVNTREVIGIADKLHVSPYGGNYLSGTKETFTVSATDENDYPVEFDDETEFSSTGSTYTSNDGTAVLEGNGKVTVTAKSGNLEGSTTVNVFTNPDSIKIYDKDTGKEIKSLSLSGGETVSLTADAIVGSKVLIADEQCFLWSADETIGSITEDGTFTSSFVSAKGNIKVKAGNKTHSIPVTVSGGKYDAYTDASVSYDDDNVYVKLVSNKGISVEKENISVSADGEYVDFDYDGGIVTIKREHNMRTKIIVAYTNSLGMRSIKAYTAEGEEYSNNFVDISGHWGEGVVSYMSKKGIINGVPNKDGTFNFNPDMNMTRYEFAVMTANYMGIEPSDFAHTELSFDDSDKIPSWAINQIKLLVTTGIMNGKTNPDGTITFSGTDNITRAEAIAVLGRVFGETIDTTEMNYSDFDSVPKWAKDGFTTLVSMGVMSGYDDGTLKPDKNITRAEAIKLVYGIY